MPYCDLHNPTRRARIIYGANGRQITIKTNETVKDADLAPHVIAMLKQRRNDLVITVKGLDGSDADEPAPEASIATTTIPSTAKAISISGMLGIGDTIHQRSILKELMKDHDVYLDTFNVAMFHDLIAQGLKVGRKGTPRIKEGPQTAAIRSSPPSGARKHVHMTYGTASIKQHGTILGAMYQAAGLTMPGKPDFSLPILPEWRESLEKKLADVTIDKPLMVFRPIVQNKVWPRPNRSPDVDAYMALYQHLRNRYFVVSVANLRVAREWIVGPEQDADLKFHAGELDFETMAALFEKADLVFGNAGFAPVLAQSVGTPLICVYGGNESSKSTNIVGAHLAPSCFIEPIAPCDCHEYHHRCVKDIDIPAAMAKIDAFLEAKPSRRAPLPRTLIFGTSYINNEERAKLVSYWQALNVKINPWCNRLLVDTPDAKFGRAWKESLEGTAFVEFNDNVGHLARGGKDGWGRAFTTGLQYAIDEGYEFVAHIEGDLLFKPALDEIIRQMRDEKIMVMSAPAVGTKFNEAAWVETACIIFNVDYLKRTNFIGKYDWANSRRVPPPEAKVKQLVKDDVRIAKWRGQRNDMNNLALEEAKDLDFITHCRDFDFYRTFMGETAAPIVPPKPIQAVAPVVKINLGCGTNKLDGWQNCDAEVDISKPLPFPSRHADFILAEHVVEHVDYYAAITFFKECLRVLKPGGVLRIAVPSLEQIRITGDDAYYKFTTKWQPGATARGAMHAIIYCHGHKTAWTASLLDSTLFYVGFDEIAQQSVGESKHEALCKVEGHHKVIGEAFNAIETMVFEATKALPPVIEETPTDTTVAVIVAGAECWEEDLGNALRLIEAAGCRPKYFFVNDHIASFPRHGIAVTLHPDKLTRWLTERAAKGFLPPEEIWAHRTGKHITHNTRDWAGSVGLLGVKIAREKGFEKVICIGMPMTAEAGHFVRKTKWHAFNAFRKGWTTNKAQIAPYVRSMSGWTAEILGRPDVAFLR